ncbi:STAS domain-containing protein [Anaerovorax odorimutans]|uniref:Anti-sigma factor antagonist n=1 Tax=Anaerovorax odorimutans TaxID=109327 RepID=A0ABT1RKL2_9FIRM|nr:STAS domain-containing protein [Anaerovorax odorimutans]MCQ4635725.1 STAS domain-containing protein [Anaerovorax odorimutans]
MEMNIKTTGKVMEVYLEGRLDANTAPDLTEAVKDAQFEELIIDLEKLEYISSAGLRSLLVAKKTADACQGKLVLRHPTPAVYDVMNMSGFTRMLDIQED